VSVIVPPRSATLRPFVRSLGLFSGVLPPGRERVLPSGDLSLIVNLHEDELRTYEGPGNGTARRTRGAALAGPRTRPTVIDTEEQRCLMWVDFHPGGAAPFFRPAISETCDELVELAELWGRDGAVLRERLLEAASPEERLRIIETALLDHLVGPPEREPAVAFAVAAFERGLTVSEVISGLGLLPNRFVRRFRSRVGLTPKRFSRVRRLQRVLRAAGRDPDVDWAGVAAEQGFYDQSHLIHDFRELAGMTPSAYRPRSAGEWNHVSLPPRD
jgi:AraC-like DNA-binding protein